MALLSLGGVRLAPGRAAAPVKLLAKIESSGGIYSFNDLSGTSGQETFNGSAKLDTSAASPHLDLDVEASSASLPFLFEPLMVWDDPFAEPASPASGVRRGAGFWPEYSIDARLLSSIGAKIKIKAGQLHLSGPLALDGAHVEANINDGVLAITNLEGGLYGGTLKASARLAAQASGLAFTAKAEASGLSLEEIAPGKDGSVPVKGPVDLEMSLQGSGLSPHGLAAGLNGEGKLTFEAERNCRAGPAGAKIGGGRSPGRGQVGSG